jgi:predicted ester cyclase
MARMFRRALRRGDPIRRRCLKKFPDIHVKILDLIAEDDKVVVRNRWTGTEAATGKKFEFSGIVMWRIAKRQLVERWAYLTPPQPAKS